MTTGHIFVIVLGALTVFFIGAECLLIQALRLASRADWVNYHLDSAQQDLVEVVKNLARKANIELAIAVEAAGLDEFRRRRWRGRPGFFFVGQQYSVDLISTVRSRFETLMILLYGVSAAFIYHLSNARWVLLFSTLFIVTVSVARFPWERAFPLSLDWREHSGKTKVPKMTPKFIIEREHR